jgi:hypothetical protein
MSDARESKSFFQKLCMVIVVLFTLVLVYILSIGPVVLYTEKTHGDFATIHQFYAPLDWLHDHTVLRKPLEMWVELWWAH